MKNKTLLPCVYGKHISTDCTVRQALRPPEDEITKRMKPYVQGAPEGILNLVNMMKDLLENEAKNLSPFCQCCPYLRRAKA